MNLKRGDRLVKKGIIWSGNHPEHGFRFRIDPVPFTFGNRRYFYSWYKKPKSTQEKRWSFAYPEYVRGKRSRWNLPDAWDDRQRGDASSRKCWKNKKIKKQWMK